MKHFFDEKYEAIIIDDYEAFGKAEYEAKQILFYAQSTLQGDSRFIHASVLHKFRKEFASLRCNL